MYRNIIGKVLPGPATEYDAAAAYVPPSRVRLGGSVWECVIKAEAGEGPVTCPEKWQLTFQPDTATIYVGGSGASDTLCDGRGLIESLPYETLSAAYAWAKKNCGARQVIFTLLGDVDEGGKTLHFQRPGAWSLIYSPSQTTRVCLH